MLCIAGGKRPTIRQNDACDDCVAHFGGAAFALSVGIKSAACNPASASKESFDHGLEHQVEGGPV